MYAYHQRLLTELFPLISYCLLMSATPGPNNIMLASSGANFGYRGALPTVIGIQSGVFVQTIITCIGLGSVFNRYPVIQQILQVLGSMYLIYLAWQLSGASIKDKETLQPVSFTQAAIFQALNPKSWVKAITLASVFMPANMSPISGAFYIAVIGALLGTPCSLIWTFFGVSIRQLLRDPLKQKIFNLIMASSLLVLALLFLR